MKYEITKEYLELMLDFLSKRPYAEVKHIFEQLSANVKLLKQDEEVKKD